MSWIVSIKEVIICEFFSNKQLVLHYYPSLWPFFGLKSWFFVVFISVLQHLFTPLLSCHLYMLLVLSTRGGFVFPFDCVSVPFFVHFWESSHGTFFRRLFSLYSGQLPKPPFGYSIEHYWKSIKDYQTHGVSFLWQGNAVFHFLPSVGIGIFDLLLPWLLCSDSLDASLHHRCPYPEDCPPQFLSLGALYGARFSHVRRPKNTFFNLKLPHFCFQHFSSPSPFFFHR